MGGGGSFRWMDKEGNFSTRPRRVNIPCTGTCSRRLDVDGEDMRGRERIVRGLSTLCGYRPCHLNVGGRERISLGTGAAVLLSLRSLPTREIRPAPGIGTGLRLLRVGAARPSSCPRLLCEPPRRCAVVGRARPATGRYIQLEWGRRVSAYTVISVASG